MHVGGGGGYIFASKFAFVKAGNVSDQEGLQKTFLEGGVVMQVSETHQKTFSEDHFLRHSPTKE
jgi:hypothetical protein